MLATIQLDRKLSLVAIEIEDIARNRMLSSELEPKELPVSKDRPHKPFRVGLAFAKSADQGKKVSGKR